MQFWKSRREKVATCEPAAFTSRFVIFKGTFVSSSSRSSPAASNPEQPGVNNDPHWILTWTLFLEKRSTRVRGSPKKKQRRRDAGATNSQEGGFHSARARGEAGLFPDLLPLPDAGSFVENAIAELVGQHQNLTAMMRLVREHLSAHGPSGGPRWHPTVASEL